MIKIVDGDVVIEDNEKEKLEELFNEMCKEFEKVIGKCHSQKLR